MNTETLLSRSSDCEGGRQDWELRRQRFQLEGPRRFVQEVRSRWAGTHWTVDLTGGSTGAAILLTTHGRQGNELPLLLWTRKAMTLRLVMSYQPPTEAAWGL